MSKPVERWTDKWKSRASVAKPDYIAGIQNPSRDPVAAAIEQKQSLMTKMQDSATWDKWEQGLRFVGQAGWQAAALSKGADRFTTGVNLGAPKFADFAGKFKAHLDAQLPAVRKMPNTNIEEAKAKAGAMIEANSKFRYKK